MKNYLVTRAWLRANRACYSDEQIDSLIPESGLLMSDVLELDIPDADKVWVFCHSDCGEKQDFVEFAESCAARAAAVASVDVAYSEFAAAYAVSAATAAARYAAAAAARYAASAAAAAARYAASAAATERKAQVIWIKERILWVPPNTASET